MPISYAQDIRPLFRVRDVNAMKRFGPFDLTAYEDVADRANEILLQLRSGTMPCDGAWPQDRVELFERWITDGKQP